MYLDYKQLIFESIIILGIVFFYFIVRGLLNTFFEGKEKDKYKNIALFLGGLFLVLYAFSKPISAIVAIVFIVLHFFIEKHQLKKELKKQEQLRTSIVLKTKEGEDLIYENPYGNFLLYGAQGSGKTLSGGKPLLAEYMRLGFTLFIYDAKDRDYTNTALWIKDDIKYPYPIYTIDYDDLSCSHRFNIMATIKDEEFLSSNIQTIYSNLIKGKDFTEWDYKGVAVLEAAAYYIFTYEKQFYTLPHIMMFVIYKTGKELISFFKKDDKCSNIASALIKSEGSEKTLSSILTTVTGIISKVTKDKKICWLLTGEDFELNTVDPENPKTICFNNPMHTRNNTNLISSLIFSLTVRNLKKGNQIPFCAFLDEATSKKIPNLEEYPSELREYLFSMVMITQSASKIEKVYGKKDLSILENNINNHIYMKTNDLFSLDNFVQKFSKKKVKKKSVTKNNKNGGKSTTTHESEKFKYEKEEFKKLRKGEAIGFASEANMDEFKVRFKKFYGDSKEDNLVQNVTREDLEENYNKIINEVKNIQL